MYDNVLTSPHFVFRAIQAAFDKLDSIYGTYTEKSDVKSNFQLPRHCMTNTDLNRIINSDEVCISTPLCSLAHLL